MADAVHIAHFTEMSRATVDGPYDVSLVEGSITTPADAERIQEVRASSRRLVTIGACATAGGIQGLRNFAASGEYAGTVYAHPEYISSLDTSTPIAAHVAVDFELHGCPIDRHQLLEVITASLAGRRPVIPGHSVCQECKGRGTVCLLVAEGIACLGPVTRTGCGALCPPSVGAASAASGPPTPPTRRRWPPSCAARAWHRSTCRGSSAPSTPARPPSSTSRWPREVRSRSTSSRAVRARRPGEGVMTHGRVRRGPSASRASRGSRARARCGSRSATATVTDVALEIFEPPRYFEALLVGRHFTEAPDITARICGICPVAYQMSACAAMEDACGVTVDERVDRLRRLLYCGEWIQSHALHVYLLHAPDFLGCADAVELAERDRGAVERGLQIKRTGNLVMETVGGRAVHPVNVRVGGFYRAPDPTAVAALAEPLRRARDAALATVEWVAGFDFPDVDGDYRFVALRDGDRYPIERGRPASSDGLDVSPAEFADLVVEEHVARSTALHARLGGRDPYLTGPLGPLRAQRRRRSPPWPPRRRPRPGWARCAPTRSAASWCAPSSWCSPATRRCRWSSPTRRPTLPPSP